MKLKKSLIHQFLVLLLFVINAIGISYTLATRFTSILFAPRAEKTGMLIGCLMVAIILSSLLYLVIFQKLLRFASFRQLGVILFLSLLIIAILFYLFYAPPPFPENHLLKVTALGEHNPASTDSRVHIQTIRIVNYPSLTTRRVPSYELFHQGTWRRVSDSSYEIFVENKTTASVELSRFMQAGIELTLRTGPNSGLAEIAWDEEVFIVDLYQPADGENVISLEPALNWRKADRVRKMLVGAAFLSDFPAAVSGLAICLLTVTQIASRHIMIDLRRTRTLVVGTLVIFAVLTVVIQTNTFVHLDNPVLEEGVRAALNRPQGNLFRRQLLTLVSLDLSNMELTSLKGIEHLTNLESLNVRNNRLDDISQLAGLNRLESLDLRNNLVSDISPIVGLHRLQYLNLYGNSAIRSIKPLASLTGIKKLILGNIPVGEQVNIISALTELEYLNLRNSGLQHTEFLAPLTRLRYLNLYANPDIRSIKAISKLSQLEILILADIPLNGQATLLSNLRKLSYLNLRNTNLTDISFLADLKDLEYLNLNSNTLIQDIKSLEQLTKLKHLILRDVPVNDQADVLASLTNLRSINLRNTGITSLEFLSQLIANGALQDNLKKSVSASVDIRDNPIPMGGSDPYAGLRPYWKNIAIREPLILPFYAGLEKPVASYPSGFYENGISVSLAHPDKNVDLYYTLDGSEPDTSSFIYSGPIELNASNFPPLSAATIESIAANWRAPQADIQKAAILRIKAFDPLSGQESPVVSHTYFFWDGSSQRYTMPIISIISEFSNFFDPDDGIYVLGNAYQAVAQDDITEDEKQLSANFNQRGEAWERPVHIEFMNLDGESVFSQNGGVRIHGSGSRRNAQKSFRIYADCAYDVECHFNHPLFDTQKINRKGLADPQFEAFLLRGFGQDWLVGLIRDALANDILSEVGLDYQAQQPMIVFLNGEYWGIYQLQERYDEFYFRNHYGISPDDLTILRTFGSLSHGNPGDARAFSDLMRFIRTNQIADDDNFEYIASQIDLENFTDYLIANIFLANKDWPNNNVFLWKYTGEDPDHIPGSVFDGRWRWLLNDMDFILGLQGYGTGYEHNTLESALSESQIGELLSSLLENDSYRTYFLNRFADHINTTFLATRVIEAIDRKQGQLAPEMQEYFARWGSNNENLLNDWYDEVNDMRTFALKRAEYITNHFLEHFGLTGTSNLRVSHDPQQGSVLVNSIQIPEVENWEGTYFEGVPITLVAIPQPGFQFSHWDGPGVQQPEIVLELTTDTALSPVFISDQSD